MDGNTVQVLPPYPPASSKQTIDKAKQNRESALYVCRGANVWLAALLCSALFCGRGGWVVGCGILQVNARYAGYLTCRMHRQQTAVWGCVWCVVGLGRARSLSLFVS